MKTLIALSMLFAAQTAFAGKTTVLECDFTEPFITLTIDLVKKTAIATSYNFENEVDPSKPGEKLISKNVKVTGIGSNPKFKNAKVYAADGTLMLTVSYSGQASNGMSDGIYPYDARWEMLGNNTGACESNLLKAKEQ